MSSGSTPPRRCRSNTWSHVAVTLSGTTGTLYVNGVAVATNTAMTLHPSSLGSTTNNWIGRSQYADPYLNAAVDDFQIYNRALSADRGRRRWPVARPGAGNVRRLPLRRGQRRDRHRLVRQRAQRHDQLTGGSGGTELVPWQGLPAEGPHLRHRSSAGRTSRTSRRSSTASRRTPPTTRRRCATTPTRPSSRSCPRTRPTRPTRPPRSRSATAAATTSRTSTRRCRPGSTRRRCATIRRSTSPRTRTGSSSSGCRWNEDINGDNRYPGQQRVLLQLEPDQQDPDAAPSIHHDVLGSYNWMFFEDVAGIQARLDNTLELYPIDMGYDHFTVNNVRYHGSNLTDRVAAARRHDVLPVGAGRILGLRRRRPGVHGERPGPRVVELGDRRGQRARRQRHHGVVQQRAARC